MASPTIIPGMPAVPAGAQPKSPAMYPGMPAPAAQSEKPILGFLYSVSRTPYGEYWPLYVGPNSIGRGSENSICLSETSVSEKHATIVIRKMQKQGSNNGIFVFVQDNGSVYGTLLNGDTLAFDPKECKSGDVITIGANYELFLILVDPEALGLAPKPDFQASEKKAVAVSNLGNPEAWGQAPVQNVQPNVHKGTMPGTFNGGFEYPVGGMQPQGNPAAAPVAAPGQSSNPFDNKKATIYMPKK